MRNKYEGHSFLITLTLNAIAWSAPLEKQNLASNFFDATIAKQVKLVADSTANGFLKENPTKIREAEIYRQWAFESFSSQEYKEIYTKFLIENFNENELIEMNQWAKSPHFLSYMLKWQGFQQWSQPMFRDFLKLKNPDLARRLRAEDFDPNK